MSSKMLIDAAHPEETRVVVVRGNRLEDFDYESATRKQLKGNIYLAKVTRVEPSLQAAFVDYGGNRHGFLAFNEIHPDYYQIPVADRQALLEEEEQEESRAQAEELAQDDKQTSKRGSRRKKPRRKSAKSKDNADDAGSDDTGPDTESSSQDDATQLEASNLTETVSEEAEASETDDDGAESAENGNGESVESVGSEDVLEEVPVRTRRKRNYKIQEVIKRRQIILIQVVKEERGNKGAALTTYISLAGRYTVLMPNTARGGGISRKITNATDRKRLRKIASDLDVAQGMGLIIRTAGASRTKAEIKRDFEYLLRMWENIRDLTLQSTAPTLVYEEGNLIKRSIRDLYGKGIDGVIVAGDEAYKEAKGFMKLLMPSHAKNVQPYKEPEPIFVRHQIERQLGAMYSPHVTLRSGGYIVINQTEALVSVDVNSGKSTREHSIEDTALRTNLEAAEELSRQLRLRDLAGLIVIDFIDMEERRNNRAVEHKLKDSLKNDRARIQIGRISHFGLMEMSRQRLRAGVLEGSTSTCTLCQGTGIVRSTESMSLDILRTLEDTLLNEGAANLVATTSYEIALYILNQKRASLKDIENRYDVSITIAANNELQGASFSIVRDKTAARSERKADATVVSMDDSYHTATEDDESGREREIEGERKRPRRRGRRRGRGRAEREGNGRDDTMAAPAQAEESSDDTGTSLQDSSESEEGARRPRRRGRRGGRRTRGSGRGRVAAAEAGISETVADSTPVSGATAPVSEAPASEAPVSEAPVSEAPVSEATVTEAQPESASSLEAEVKPKRKPRARRKPGTKASEAVETAETAETKTSGTSESAEKKKPARSRKKPAKAAKKANDGDTESSGKADDAPAPAKKTSASKSAATKAAAKDVKAGKTTGDESKAEPQRSGWWQRRA
ncbi:MAG: Rne/Rng family ribonuclease [Alphaproteobacteria bacterium]